VSGASHRRAEAILQHLANVVPTHRLTSADTSDQAIPHNLGICREIVIGRNSVSPSEDAPVATHNPKVTDLDSPRKSATNAHIGRLIMAS